MRYITAKSDIVHWVKNLFMKEFSKAGLEYKSTEQMREVPHALEMGAVGINTMVVFAEGTVKGNRVVDKKLGFTGKRDLADLLHLIERGKKEGKGLIAYANGDYLIKRPSSDTIALVYFTPTYGTIFEHMHFHIDVRGSTTG